MALAERRPIRRNSARKVAERLKPYKTQPSLTLQSMFCPTIRSLPRSDCPLLGRRPRIQTKFPDFAALFGDRHNVKPQQDRHIRLGIPDWRRSGSNGQLRFGKRFDRAEFEFTRVLTHANSAECDHNKYETERRQFFSTVRTGTLETNRARNASGSRTTSDMPPSAKHPQARTSAPRICIYYAIFRKNLIYQLFYTNKLIPTNQM